jgi:adenylate kinase
MGPPGCGKGTLSQACVDRLGWKQISTGNLCRKNIQEQTDIGKAIDFAIKSGKLVSDTLVTQMVIDWFENKAKGFSSIIIDGYPRTLIQAQDFDTFLAQFESDFRVVLVFFDIDFAEVTKRLASRCMCSNKECQAVFSLTPGAQTYPKKENTCDYCGSSLLRRADDESEAVTVRLAMYADHYKDLCDYYSDTKHAVVRLQADQPAAALFEDFVQQIGTVE